MELASFDGERHTRTKAALEVATRMALESTPIYRLEGRTFKETTAQHFVTEAFVRDGKLHLKLGPAAVAPLPGSAA